jgi:hypothetical protein
MTFGTAIRKGKECSGVTNSAGPGKTDHHDVGHRPAKEAQMARRERRRFTGEYEAEAVALIRATCRDRSDKPLADRGLADVVIPARIACNDAHSRHTYGTARLGAVASA